MTKEKLVILSQMEVGQSGRVVDIKGGRRMVNRLNVLGIRPGQNITKISSTYLRGPVTIQAGRTQLAIGFGTANRILVAVGKSRND